MSINQCIFLGNLGSDPDLKFLPDGREVVNISVACTEKWKDKNDGQIKEHTEWIRAVCFGKRAKAIADYFKKGSQIHITTKSRTRKYQKDGIDHWTTEYVISHFHFCGNKQSVNGDARAQQQAQAYQPASGKPAQPETPPMPAYDGGDFDDDMPF